MFQAPQGPHQDATADSLMKTSALPMAGRTELTRRLRQAWNTGDLPILSDHRIIWRFHALMAIGLASILAFAASYGIGEYFISRAVRTQASFGAMRDLAADIRADLLGMQNMLTAYIDQHDKGLEPTLRESADKAGASLTRMQSLSVAAEEKETLDALAAGLPAMSEAVGKAIGASETLGMSDYEGLRAKLNASIRAMQSEIDVWPNQDALAARILQMRLAEKDFLVTKEAGKLRVHKRWANETDLKIDSGGLDPATREKFHGLLNAYLADWGAFGETSVVVNSSVATIQKNFRELQPKVDALFDRAQAASEKANLASIGIRRMMLWITMAIGLIAATLFQLAAVVFSRSITLPIGDMETAMGDLAAGRREVQIPGVGRRDEIGDMAKAVQVFKDNMAVMERMQADRVREHESLADRGRALENLTSAFDRDVAEIMAGVAESMAELHERAVSMTDMARATSEQMAQIDRSTQQATQGVNTIAAASEELAAQVRAITQRVSESSRVTNEAAEAAAKTDQLVTSLSDAAQNIGDVVQLITSIAHKTHMLALNATIEAVRAGDAGRGFAVVATEVKALSSQTSSATGDISSHVAAIQDKTSAAVASINRIVATTDKIRDNATAVAEAVSFQESATRDIAQSAGQAAEGAMSVAERISTAATSATEMGKAAHVMLEEASATAQRADLLRDKIARFLAEVENLRG